MNRAGLFLMNFGALAGAVAAAAALAGPLAGAPERKTAAAAPAPRSKLPRAAFAAGGAALVDGGGHQLPLRRYERIVSTSIATDRLLAELCEPNRIVAVSGTGARSSPDRFRFAGKAAVETIGAIEPIVSLRPDLVFATSFVGSGRAEKLRAAGVAVFELPPQRGLATFAPLAEAVGAVCGRADEGRRFAERLAARMARVAAPLSNAGGARRSALYLFVIAGQLYGGTRGTSYNDVLTSAGLLDAAAAAHEGWPRLSSEQVIALAPELVVTKEGVGAGLCAAPGLERLAACERPGLVLELPGPLLEEPGPAMLEAAERLFALAYPALLRRD